MQSCLEDQEAAKGPTTEFQPLPLVTPSVDEFRAFLWALYASYVVTDLPLIERKLKPHYYLTELTNCHNQQSLTNSLNASSISQP